MLNPPVLVQFCWYKTIVTKNPSIKCILTPEERLSRTPWLPFLQDRPGTIAFKLVFRKYWNAFVSRPVQLPTGRYRGVLSIKGVTQPSDSELLTLVPLVITRFTFTIILFLEVDYNFNWDPLDMSDLQSTITSLRYALNQKYEVLTSMEKEISSKLTKKQYIKRQISRLGTANLNSRKGCTVAWHSDPCFYDQLTNVLEREDHQTAQFPGFSSKKVPSLHSSIFEVRKGVLGPIVPSRPSRMKPGDRAKVFGPKGRILYGIVDHVQSDGRQNGVMVELRLESPSTYAADEYEYTTYCYYVPSWTCARTRGTRWKLWSWNKKESSHLPCANKEEVEIHVNIDEKEEMDTSAKGERLQFPSLKTQHHAAKKKNEASNEKHKDRIKKETTRRRAHSNARKASETTICCGRSEVVLRPDGWEILRGVRAARERMRKPVVLTATDDFMR
ncbi:unnamed protein product [Darwinula stevensoni]|uniref:Uncharacterized protein n=1 Tax=Darwinula stevensoni TaxID=69355 RepID=A0A7R9AAM0_9CRUS|nr:unnamed protein product [Darwinula stevensoni]CAG0898284.1 unnamed protein product [Darwinula stevensoni]